MEQVTSGRKGVPFVLEKQYGWVEGVRNFEDGQHIKMTGQSRWFWVKCQPGLIAVDDEVMLEKDEDTIIGVWHRVL